MIGWPSSFNSFHNHNNSVVVVAIVPYSTYVKDLAIVGCFLEDQKITLDPNINKIDSSRLAIMSISDTNNNIMGPKNKNSLTIEKVKRSTRMGQRPKWLENYTCWRQEKRQCVECEFSSPLLLSSSFSHLLF